MESEFKPVERPLELTKAEAALRQVTAAISAFERGDHDIAITLAGAAEGMLPASEINMMKVMLWFGGAENDPQKKKARIDYLNGPLYWLKHETPQLSSTRIITAHDAAVMIVRAISKLPDAPESLLEPFLGWFNPHMLQWFADGKLRRE